MPFERKIILPGSENVQRPGLEAVGGVQPDETIRVSVILRRAAVEYAAQSSESAGQPEQRGLRLGSDPADILVVEEFAHHAGLTVVESNPRKRRVILTGTADEIRNAFGAELVTYKEAGSDQHFLGRKGTLAIPTELQGIVTAILGLDKRPVAKPHFRVKHAAAAATTSYTPPQVAALYNFPTAGNGSGQTVAIIELGGGYKTADLDAYFKSLKLKSPSVTAVSVDGGKNTPGSDADGEVMLDIEVVGAVANGAKIAVYFAPNTDKGFIDAITDAVHDTTRKPSVISISWGAPEDSWSVQSRNAMNAALQDAATLGVTVTVASGDNGSTDGATDKKLHVDFPASSPFALACGGTTLNGSGKTISSEVVWNEIAKKEGATGGGVSTAFPLPSYQQSAKVPKQPQTNFVGRGVPDVAGDADPTTGYQIRVNGQNQVIGGTSAVAPLWAGLIALINQQLGKPVGFLNPKLYTLGSGAFRDITSGNNDDSNLGYYKAQVGWDACTGLGSPNGAALLKSLSNSTGSSRSAIAGSAPNHSPSANWSDIPNPEQHSVEATILLRRKGGDAADQLLLGGTPQISSGEAEAATAASPEDIAQVSTFAQQHGLSVKTADPVKRTVQVEGSAAQMQRAFGVDLGLVSETSGNQYLSHREAICIPHSLSNLITAVLGLDQRPIARPLDTSKV
ncbi:MAG: protease pro-enzyme activation domain-containing protein [Bryobacteraceae bacterium]